jgi:AraC family transcriptional regulator of arabinose operon
MTAAAAAAHPFGVLSAHTKDQMYLVRRGHVFTSPWVVAETTRFSASILLTAKRSPFEMSINGCADRYRAVAVKPLVKRHLRAEDVQLVSIGISPSHRHYRQFRVLGCPGPGYLALPRDAYTDFDIPLQAAYNGTLTIDAAQQLFEDIVDLTVAFFPRLKRADPRIERALEMLQEKPHYPLTELADAVGLSYDRMSHLFADAVGLPLRSYTLWQKLRVASSLFHRGMTLTEIAVVAGFTDSAHLSNAWLKAYGASPSYFINSDCVEVRAFPGRAVRRPIPAQRFAER